MYTVEHTIDNLGGKFFSPMPVLKTTDLEYAKEEAEKLTRQGLCGHVRRDGDDAILRPDGSWYVAGEEEEQRIEDWYGAQELCDHRWTADDYCIRCGADGRA